MRSHRALGPCVLALLLGLGSTARADDDVLSDTARELFLKAVKAHEQQRWDQCRAALLAAFAIKRHGQIAGNLSECELKLGMYRDAAEHAWFFAHTLRADAPPERRAAAEGLLAEVLPKVVTVTVTVDVDDAAVLVDGRSAGKTPLTAPVFVEPGQHTVEALRAGFPGARVIVDAGAGETREVALTLKVKDGPAPPPVVAVGERRPIWPALAAGGVAVVALGVGAGLTVAANGKAADGATLRAKVGSASACMGSSAASADCAALLDTFRRRDSLSDAAFVSFAAGGVTAAAAVALGVWTLRTPKGAPRPDAMMHLVPVVAKGGGGVVVLGAW